MVENAFQKRKRFRAFATRFDELVTNYSIMIALAFAVM
jgi:transposase